MKIFKHWYIITIIVCCLINVFIFFLTLHRNRVQAADYLAAQRAKPMIASQLHVIRSIQNIGVYKALDKENKLILNTLLTNLSNRYQFVQLSAGRTNINKNYIFWESWNLHKAIRELEFIKEDCYRSNCFLTTQPFVSYDYKVLGGHITYLQNQNHKYSLYDAQKILNK